MLKELVDAIQDGVKTETIDINGEVYATRQVFRVPTVPMPASLQIATLQGIVDYLNGKIDEADQRDLFVHVVEPETVFVCAFLNDLNGRENLIKANYESTRFTFGSKYEQSEFITLLQSCFVDTPERARLQKLVGGLVDDSSVKLTDNGIAQETVGKTGITSVERQNVSNPFKLKPFRTFAEIEQPESNFILRLHKCDGAPMISLHESDNAFWKIDAINDIKGFLKDKIKVPVIA